MNRCEYMNILYSSISKTTVVCRTCIECIRRCGKAKAVWVVKQYMLLTVLLHRTPLQRRARVGPGRIRRRPGIHRRSSAFYRLLA